MTETAQKEIAKPEGLAPSSSQTLALQEDIEKELSHFGTKFDHWANVMKASLLSEYETTKALFGEKRALEFNIRKTELESRITELVKENNFLKVDLIKSNDKFTARNKLVERMITQQSSKDSKNLLSHSFFHWQLQVKEKRNAVVSIKLARAIYRKNIKQKVFYEWKMRHRDARKDSLERKIRRECEFQIAMVNKSEAEKIQDLQSQVQRLTILLENSYQERIQQQEEMRRAFLRGVSALNSEAMGVLKKAESPAKVSINFQNFESISETEHPLEQLKTYREDSTGIYSTNGLVTRHYKK